MAYFRDFEKRYPFQALIVDDSSSADPLGKSRGGGGRPEDVDCIAATQSRLRESGFYYEGVSWQEAIDLLANKPEGTFLVRDSQDPRFLFSLSVQTKRGPTSVRIHYDDGLFSFDAVRKMARAVPRKKCVVDLVDFYVSVCDSDRLKCHVWLDKNGDTFDHVRLRAPLKHRVAPLKHAARLALNRAAVTKADLAKVLPASLKLYLEEYPNTS
ncbi:unnamed protein product [Notodromas monacha]|uniref:SH2 domain-containing protein n=1 Tax=Notodromas monacha TaxID=399045 RepID=A0A7R9C0Q5_9CRUS|nr:unnamed protein product [Notodromas monacha]CAG0925176.1 unnamed protein product [Notodromas monacha]